MRRTRGSAFIVALAVLVGLVALLAAVAASQRTAVRAQINRQQILRARVAAQSAVDRALAELATLQANAPTTLQDDWATLGNRGAENFIVGDTSFRMEIVDASSRININTAPEGLLQRLPLTTEQIESLLDWRETSRTPRAEGGKDEFYNNLPEAYNARLRRFDTVDELLQVKGFSPRMLFDVQTDVTNSATATQGNVEDQIPLFDLFTADSYSANTAPGGQGKVNVNSNAATAANIAQRIGAPLPIGFAIVAGRPYARLGDVLARVTPNFYAAVLDNLALAGTPRVEGKLNLNTATEQALLAVPGLTSDQVQAILQRQGTGINSLGEIINIPGLNSIAALQPSVDFFTTSSQSFIVRAIGRAGDREVAIEATIVIENQLPRVYQVRDYPLDDPITRWGWEADPTSEVVLKEAGS